uniref:Dehydrogenase/reductase 7 n=1 Tax=Pipistrellus kuhlii TaxID=59472 RepID=A0A7J8AZF8_PIPKU|nr:dehydrogenase/reductase 7 [Pipistrellus kuhlii]
MSGDLLLWLLALGALLALAVQLLRFLRADGDLTLLWAEWQGRRPEWELTDMVVWVTGASSGIGEELAYQLSKLGVSLVLSARRENELERVKRRCLENGNLKGKDILVLPFDLADISSHEVATKAVLQEFGKIDILVNNGGRSQRSLCVESSMDIYKEMIELNYLGTVSLTKCVLPHMIERKQGKIVTVNSFMGILAAPLSTGYCASKHALRAVHSDVDQSHKMATGRCVRLMLICMANDLKEVWIADQPFLSLAYLWQYMPTWAMWLTNKLGKKRIENFKKGLDADSSYFKIWKTKHD